MPRLGERPAVFSKVQCTAKSKRSGKRCRNYAVRGRPTCRIHGGRSKRGKDHWNYVNGLHSKDVKEAGEMMGRLLRRPVEVRVVLYPESVEEMAEKVGRASRQRFWGRVVYPNEYGQLPLLEQLRVLRAAKKEINSQLRDVYQAVRRMESDLMDEEGS